MLSEEEVYEIIPGFEKELVELLKKNYTHLKIGDSGLGVKASEDIVIPDVQEYLTDIYIENEKHQIIEDAIIKLHADKLEYPLPLSMYAASLKNWTSFFKENPSKFTYKNLVHSLKAVDAQLRFKNEKLDIWNLQLSNGTFEVKNSIDFITLERELREFLEGGDKQFFIEAKALTENFFKALVLVRAQRSKPITAPFFDKEFEKLNKLLEIGKDTSVYTPSEIHFLSKTTANVLRTIKFLTESQTYLVARKNTRFYDAAKAGAEQFSKNQLGKIKKAQKLLSSEDLSDIDNPQPIDAHYLLVPELATAYFGQESIDLDVTGIRFKALSTDVFRLNVQVSNVMERLGLDSKLLLNSGLYIESDSSKNATEQLQSLQRDLGRLTRIANIEIEKLPSIKAKIETALGAIQAKAASKQLSVFDKKRENFLRNQLSQIEIALNEVPKLVGDLKDLNKRAFDLQKSLELHGVKKGLVDKMIHLKLQELKRSLNVLAKRQGSEETPENITSIKNEFIQLLKTLFEKKCIENPLLNDAQKEVYRSDLDKIGNVSDLAKILANVEYFEKRISAVSQPATPEQKPVVQTPTSAEPRILPVDFINRLKKLINENGKSMTSSSLRGSFKGNTGGSRIGSGKALSH